MPNTSLLRERFEKEFPLKLEYTHANGRPDEVLTFEKIPAPERILSFLESEIQGREVELREKVEKELAEIIVDTEGLTKFPIGSVELHTTIGGNAGTRRAIEIVRSHLLPTPVGDKEEKV